MGASRQANDASVGDGPVGGAARRGAEPERYGLTERAKDLLRLKKEHGADTFAEGCGWVHIYRNAAYRETEGIVCDLERGAAVTEIILSRVPVSILPQETVATYGLVAHTKEQRDGAWKGVEGYPGMQATRSHIAMDYGKVLAVGVKGILAEINAGEARLAEAGPGLDEGGIAAAERKASFYASAGRSLKALLHYADRFRAEAARLANSEPDPGRRGELSRIAESLGRVPNEPAQGFFDALQSMMICFFALRMVAFGEPNSVGRMDYLLDGYYRRDLASGKVTARQAAELLQVPRIMSAIMTGQSDSITIAGSRPDGGPFWNDLTYFILDATSGLRLQGPQIWFRYAPGQPKGLLERALEPIRGGMAQPGFFNDAVAVEAMARAGYAKEHARDYVSCQCVEITPQGRSNVMSGYLYANLAKPLEVILGGGEEMVEDPKFKYWSDGHVPESALRGFDDFESLMEAYEEYLGHLLSVIRERADSALSHRARVSLTLSSALLEGCVEKGVPANEGGATYNQTFPTFTGLVTAADSLAAIEKAVFEDGVVSLAELAEACRENYAGREWLRQYLLNRCPKYGNEDGAADGIALRIMRAVDGGLTPYRNLYGAQFGPQYFGWKVIDEQSYTLAATPDGRRHGETPTGTFGGDQGRDRNGLTALLNSTASLDHTLAPGGLNVNARISASILGTDEDVGKMADALIAYFKSGGMEVQVNCVSKEQLLDAQRNPDGYRDLCIRVSGQSLYFTELGLALQNQIISRAEHGG